MNLRRVGTRCASFCEKTIKKIIMKQTLIKTLIALAVTALVTLALSSCGSRGGRTTAQSEGEEYLSSLTKADTTSLLAIADSCMTLLVSGEYEKALAGVGYVDGETIEAMTPEMIARTAMSFKSLGVHGFERSGFELSLSDKNTVSYRLKIGGHSAGSGTAAITPTTGFAFNAYRIDGQWYITLKQ